MRDDNILYVLATTDNNNNTLSTRSMFFSASNVEVLSFADDELHTDDDDGRSTYSK